MSSIMSNNALLSSRNLRWRYRITLALSGLLLLFTISGYAIFALKAERTNIQNEILANSLQIQNALNAKVNLAETHVASMRRTIEKHLEFPALAPNNALPYLKKQSRYSSSDAPWETLPTNLQTEVGSLQIDPTFALPSSTFRRDVNAVLCMMPGVVANHSLHSVFQWSYYYDAKQRWFLVFPKLSQKEFFKATGADNSHSAIQFYFDADGTVPVTTVGPNKNPSRSHLWTPPYTDAGGKGIMVTLLAPIYLGIEYVGAVGTDVTLQILESTFHDYPPLLGRAFVVDNENILLADSSNRLSQSNTKVGLNNVLPEVSLNSLKEFPIGKISEYSGAIWISRPLQGTSWRLLIYIPITTLNTQLAKTLRPYLVLAFGLFIALIGLAWIQNRRFTQPALRLAEFVDEVSHNPNVNQPEVPRVWMQWFDRVANTAIERKNYLEETLKHASELEQKVDDRTLELKEKNKELTKLLGEVQNLKLQQDRDYFLLSLLIEPLVEINFESKKIVMEFFIKQKKKFEFSNDTREIGGDSNVCHSIKLGGKDFIVFINADAMGKSLQGAGGVLVFASVFKSIIERTKKEAKTINPKKWLLDLFDEIHKVFETFQCSMLISGAFCLLEEDTGILYYILFDHPPIVLYRDDKAKFLGTNFIYPKLGLWLLNARNVKVETYHVKKGDSLILGSDGRDDICLDVDTKGLPIINQDENLFIKHVENAKGDLQKIYEEIRKVGEQYDDISMIRITRI